MKAKIFFVLATAVIFSHNVFAKDTHFSRHENGSINTIINNERQAKFDRESNFQTSPFMSKNIQKFPLRRHEKVTRFYNGMAKNALKICLGNNIPPAAVLAIAGLESGWNQGYVGQITGNILSLGARKGDHALPPLYLPRLISTNQILFDSLEIIQYKHSDLKWEKRPPSLKKDYRPLPFAGTKNNLAYFKYNPEQKKQAHLDNIKDFVTIFISHNSRIQVYSDARKRMDQLVAANGKEVLLKEKTAIQFVNTIGGKPNSFNFRKTWPVKVNTIIKKAGLVNLTAELNNNKKFEDIW